MIVARDNFSGASQAQLLPILQSIDVAPGTASILPNQTQTIELPAKGDLNDVVGRLEHGGVEVVEEADGLAAADPSANRVLFRVA